MLILEWVLLVGTCLIQIITPSSWLGLGRWSNLCRQNIFPFCLKRLLRRAPCRLVWPKLTFFLLSFDPYDNFLYLLALQDELLSGTTFGHSYLSEECALQIMAICLYRCRRGHAARTSECHALKSLDSCLIDSSFFCFVARRVGTEISVSSSKKRARNSFLRSAHILIEPARSFMNHSNVTPLRVPMNKWAMMTSFNTIFSVWHLK